MNVNTTIGYQNLPAQSITTTATATPLLVPAQGLYATLPSPTLAAGAGLWVGIPQDVANSECDGHPFKVRVAGKIFTGAASTVTFVLYQVPAATIAAGTVSTLAGDQAVVTLAASASITGAANFVVEAEFLWDSTSTKLNGFLTSASFSGANIGTFGAASTPVTVPYTVASGVNGLNFIPTFSFSAGNAANTVTVTEFALDRV